MDIVFSPELAIFLLFLLMILPPLLIVVIIIIIISASIRRLHDVGKNGWIFLINVIPIIGNAIFLILMLKSGNIEENKYGVTQMEDSSALKNKTIFVKRTFGALISICAFVIVIVVFDKYVKFSNPENELPRGGLFTGNEWFVEEGNPNSNYESNITLKFEGDGNKSDDNRVEAWEGGKTRACVTGGHFSINESRTQIVISGFNNGYCSWMSSLNGTYTYQYASYRDGYNKYQFKKGDIIITHNFDEDRK